MSSIKKFLLTMMTLLPSSAISTVAHAQLLASTGEDQTNLLESETVKARRLLMPIGATATTIEDAKKLLSDQTGITEENALEQEFQKQVKILVDKGIVETNEKNLMSSSPSRWF